jgi:hypothetical protein
MNINANIGKASGREHQTTVDGQKLFLWQKPRTGEPDRGTILFVHGSSMASTPGFDLQAPGYVSAMDFFAGQAGHRPRLVHPDELHAPLSCAAVVLHAAGAGASRAGTAGAALR